MRSLVAKEIRAPVGASVARADVLEMLGAAGQGPSTQSPERKGAFGLSLVT